MSSNSQGQALRRIHGVHNFRAASGARGVTFPWRLLSLGELISISIQEYKRKLEEGGRKADAAPAPAGQGRTPVTVPACRRLALKLRNQSGKLPGLILRTRIYGKGRQVPQGFHALRTTRSDIGSSDFPDPGSIFRVKIGADCCASTCAHRGDMRHGVLRRAGSDFSPAVRPFRGR